MTRSADSAAFSARVEQAAACIVIAQMLEVLGEVPAAHADLWARVDRTVAWLVTGERPN
jgi:hypothetical protein